MNKIPAIGMLSLIVIALCQGCATFSIESDASVPANARRILIVSGLAEDSSELISNEFLRDFQARMHACGLRTAAITLADFDIRRTAYADAVKAVDPDAYLILRRTAAATDTDGRETDIVYWIKLSDPGNQRIYWSADVSVKVSRRLNASEGQALARGLLRKMQNDRALAACRRRTVAE